MNLSRFVLSFTCTTLLAAPFVLHAEDPAPVVPTFAVAPSPGGVGIVDGLQVETNILKEDKNSVTLAVKVQNPSNETVRTQVVAALMDPPEVSRMARMVPMPVEVASQIVPSAVEAGAGFETTVVIKKPKGFDAQQQAAAKAASLPNVNAQFAAPPPQPLYAMARAQSKL